jgi:hypothetical protein
MIFLIACSSPQADLIIDDKVELNKPKLPEPDIKISEDLGDINVVDEKIVFSFDEVEIDDGVMLKRSIEYSENDQGVVGDLILEFDGEGEIEFIEDIPKSFAKHVDDLEFSIMPEIIDPDPKVKWVVKITENVAKRITIKAKSASASAAITKGGLISGFKSLLGDKKSIQEKKDAAISAGFISLMENFDDFSVVTELNKCQNKDEYLTNLCVVGVVAKHPKKFTMSDCDDLPHNYMDYSGGDSAAIGLIKSCQAVIKQDPKICNDISVQDYTNGQQQICQALLFLSFSKNCKDEQCKLDAMVKAGYYKGCEKLTTLKEKCLEQLGMIESARCKKLDMSYTRKDCCDKIKHEKSKNDCLGKTEEKKKDETKEDDEKSKSVSEESEISELKVTHDGGEKLYTHVRYNFTVEGPDGLYEFDLGDGRVYKKNWQVMNTYYSEPGDYEVQVTLLDGELAKGVGTVEFEVAYPYTVMDLLHNAKDVSVKLCAWGVQRNTKSELVSPAVRCNSFNAQFMNFDALEWKGRTFSKSFEYLEGLPTSGNVIQTIEGSVSEDGSKLVYFAVNREIRNPDGGVYNGELVVENIPINLSGYFPKSFTNSINLKFKGLIDHDVASYVSKFSSVLVRDGVTYTDELDMSKNASIEVIFKPSRVTGND